MPANVILDTLALDSRLAKGTISAQTLRRLYRGHGMARTVRSKANRPMGERRRWEAEHAGQFWHADVCHGKSLLINGKRVPVRIHAMLDDKSRFIVALRVTDNEREVVMLDLMLQSLRSFGAPTQVTALQRRLPGLLELSPQSRTATQPSLTLRPGYILRENGCIAVPSEEPHPTRLAPAS